MDETSEQILIRPPPMPLMVAVDAASVPLPDSPNESFPESIIVEAQPEALSSPAKAPSRADEKTDVNVLLQSPSRKTTSDAGAKPMSPEKAALAAMFDSIKMPDPALSPYKSPRKASASILSSPSKQLAPAAVQLFRHPTSPSKSGSTDSAATRDSPFRKPVLLSPSSGSGGEKASTSLSPGPITRTRQVRPRPSMLPSSSSPSARLSDLTLNFDTTGTQELIFNQDASFLAAAADVTIDDSFDVSRAKARISASAAGPRTRSSPAKLGMRGKARCSMVPEDAVPDFKERKSKVGLGVGKVVKTATGDETIELNLTGSFLGNMSVIGGNLMDESAEASMLLGNSFSISNVEAGKGEGKRGGSDDDEDGDEEEDFEKEAKNVQKWAVEAAKRQALKTPTTTTRTLISTATVKRAVPRPAAPRTSMVTPTAGSRLIKPRASLAPAATPLVRSGSSSSIATPAPTPIAEVVSEAKTPMQTRRKSTFTTTRPPVSGPARRRESLAASAAGVLPTPIPPMPALPSLAPNTPGRTRSTPTAGVGSPMKTPTTAKPRISLIGRSSAVVPTARASAGALPRPRTSLTSSATAPTSAMTTPTARPAQVRSASLATPTARAPTSRSAVVEATPTSGLRRSTSQPHGLDEPATAVPRTRTLVPRASMSRIGPAATAAAPRTTVSKRIGAGLLAERTGNGAPTSKTGMVDPAVSKIAVSSAGKRPSFTARPSVGGGFGFKPRTSAVYVGPSRSLLDGENKEN